MVTCLGPRTRVILVAAGVLALGACTIGHGSDPPTIETATATPSATATVTRVVDGDTFHVQQNGADVTVRILSINTPETVDPRRGTECYGPEASARTKTLLPVGAPVTLTPDPTQDDLDRYGRELRYVTVGGVDVGLDLVAGGYARPYKVSGPAPQRYAAYQAAAATAKAGNVGQWGACPR